MAVISELDGQHTTYTGPAVVEVPDCEPRRVEVALQGGRNRWSVGGRIAEGPRWWRGELSWDGEAMELRAGTRIALQLDDGRTALAVVEAGRATGGVAVRGIEPPPFSVP